MRFPLIMLHTLAGVQLAGAVALAHPGHGLTAAESPAHQLVEPVHNWWIAPLLVVLASASVAIRRRQLRAAQARAGLRRRIPGKDA